jgi:hypothetical protein
LPGPTTRTSIVTPPARVLLVAAPIKIIFHTPIHRNFLDPASLQNNISHFSLMHFPHWESKYVLNTHFRYPWNTHVTY